jgi:hypothetical protein
LARGFRAGGGVLPEDWLVLGRIIDAGMLAGALTKPHLPPAAAIEIAGLLRVACNECAG